jgi:hypothetical protein
MINMGIFNKRDQYGNLLPGQQPENPQIEINAEAVRRAQAHLGVMTWQPVPGIRGRAQTAPGYAINPYK